MLTHPRPKSDPILVHDDGLDDDAFVKHVDGVLGTQPPPSSTTPKAKKPRPEKPAGAR